MKMDSIMAAAGLSEPDLHRKSRIAALWYFLMAVTAPFSLLYIPSRFIVHGDAAATMTNIMASETLFRLGIVSYFVSQVCFLLTAIALYALLKQVDKGLARIMAVLVIVSVPIAFINTLCQIAAMLLAGGAGYLKAFAPAQLQSLAMAFLDIHGQGNFITEVFWGLWLLPLGILVIKSGWFPKVLGILQIIACFGYLTGCFVFFLFPSVHPKISPIANTMAFGEIPFLLWLIIFGARVKTPRRTAAA